MEAAVAANKRLSPVTMNFRLGEESSVGRNSRLLLANGMIYWTGSQEDFVRPTGPFDPELPVWAFRRKDGLVEALMFNHSTHTIGAKKPGVRSPGFYGMAAQELEPELGGTVLFFEGASGSTHNLELNGPEMTTRIKQAVLDALGKAKPQPVDVVRGIRKEVTIKVRDFDESKDDAAVVAYEAHKIKDPKTAQFVVDIFRDMQGTDAAEGSGAKDLGPGDPDRRHCGRRRARRVFHGARPGHQAALPFRHTYDLRTGQRLHWLCPRSQRPRTGRLPDLDRSAQLRPPGTGEMIVDEAVTLLKTLHEAPQSAAQAH